MSWLDARARRAGRAASLVRTAARTLLPVDTNPVPADWSHVTKVDPEDDKRLPLLYPLYLGHTSAVSVGGSRDVTAANTEATFRMLEWVDPPAFHEPSEPRHVTDATRDAAAFLAVPEVLNGDVDALVGTLGAGVEYIRDELAPAEIRSSLPVPLPGAVADALAEFATAWLLESAVFEAYLIQNADSAAARESSVTADDLLDPTRARRLAMAAERHLGSEVVYLEYSGTYGGEEAAELLEAIRGGVTWSRVWYGGGLDSATAADAMLSAGADAVVVGDAFHEVAAEEARLGARLAAAVADEEAGGVPDRATVRAWLEREVDPSSTAAARYLSTCPGVEDATALATRYLVDSLRLWVALDALPEAADGEAARRTLRARLGDPSVESAADGIEPYLDALLRAMDASGGASERGNERTDPGGEPPLPVAHLSLGGE